jgi:hypothetical protein
MWCKHCRQDVPGIVCAESGEYRCPRCAQAIYTPLEVVWADDGPESLTASRGADDRTSDSPPPGVDDWELDDQLEHLGRALAVETPPADPAERGPRARSLRIDAAHTAPPARHADSGRQQAADPSAPNGERFSVMALVVWSVLSLGLMGFVCGGVLLGWSILGGRQDLWTIGLPIALGGQIALLVGLVLQLDRLWHDHRHTAAKLDHFDDELHDLRTTTATLNNGQTDASAGNFYAHLAGGAGPGLLLTDLKSQLDLLAVKIGQQN